MVSIGKLDENGFSATFSGGKCTLKGPDGSHVGIVPKTSKGLYRVDHKPESANEAVEHLTLDQFHCSMGHISLDVAHKQKALSLVFVLMKPNLAIPFSVSRVSMLRPLESQF